MTDAQKLVQLERAEGLDEMQLFHEATFNDLCYGICTNPDCEYTTETEPDATNNWCEKCNTQTVKSCLVLKGII